MLKTISKKYARDSYFDGNNSRNITFKDEIKSFWYIFRTTTTSRRVANISLNKW